MKPAAISFLLVYLTFLLFTLIGWVMNLIQVISLAGSDHAFNNEGIVRIVGLFIVPLGGFLGWV